VTFPVAVDNASDTGCIPMTMGKYQMRGTPTLVVLDKPGPSEATSLWTD
jgi:hypothetical protein